MKNYHGFVPRCTSFFWSFYPITFSSSIIELYLLKSVFDYLIIMILHDPDLLIVQFEGDHKSRSSLVQREETLICQSIVPHIAYSAEKHSFEEFSKCQMLQQALKKYDWRKNRVKKQNFKKRFEKNKHTCSVEGISLVSDSTASPYLK